MRFRSVARFFAIAATDGGSQGVALTCSQASGTTFPIGTTTVTCTARDAVGNVSPATSLLVKVLSATEQLGALRDYVNGLSIKRDLKRELLDKLDSGSCGSLQALTNLATAQSSKGLTQTQANFIIAAAVRIRAVMTC